jgi:hypothetical protein
MSNTVPDSDDSLRGPGPGRSGGPALESSSINSRVGKLPSAHPSFHSAASVLPVAPLALLAFVTSCIRVTGDEPAVTVSQLLRDVLGTCWARAGHVLDTCWARAGDVLGTCWGRAGDVLGTCWGRASPWLPAGGVRAYTGLYGDRARRLSAGRRWCEIQLCVRTLRTA